MEEKLAKVFHFIYQITEEKSRQPLRFSFHDVRNLVRLASGKMTRLNASTNEATVAAIVERFGGNKRIVASIVHLIDHGCQFYKVYKSYYLNKMTLFGHSRKSLKKRKNYVDS